MGNDAHPRTFFLSEKQTSRWYQRNTNKANEPITKGISMWDMMLLVQVSSHLAITAFQFTRLVVGECYTVCSVKLDFVILAVPNHWVSGVDVIVSKNRAWFMQSHNNWLERTGKWG